LFTVVCTVGALVLLVEGEALGFGVNIGVNEPLTISALELGLPHSHSLSIEMLMPQTWAPVVADSVHSQHRSPSVEKNVEQADMHESLHVVACNGWAPSGFHSRGLPIRKLLLDGVKTTSTSKGTADVNRRRRAQNLKFDLELLTPFSEIGNTTAVVSVGTSAGTEV
jgi:hypothetical protein